MISADFEHATWFGILEPDQQRAVILSFDLLEREKKLASNFPDYSFVLFSMSKAYEGFLKKFLFTLNLITEDVYLGKHFRIGRALNPDLSMNQRDQWWLYDDVERICGPELAKKLWKAWLESRNHVFHYFPGSPNTLTLQAVEQKMMMLVEVFEETYQCEVKRQQ